MKIKSIGDAGVGRIGKIFKDMWFIVQVQRKAPNRIEIEYLCNTYGVDYDDICKLLSVVSESWNNNRRA